MIDYASFIEDIFNKEIINEKLIKKCFQTFDEEHNGFLSVEEFMEIFEGKNIVDSANWKEKMYEFKMTHQENVNYKQFKKILLSFL